MPKEKNRSPIEIGLLDTVDVTGAAASLGVKNVSSVSTQRLMKGLVEYFNAHGGIAGRKINATQFSLDTNSSYESQQQSACAQFTQDHHVEVVLSVQYYYESFAQCLTRRKTPQIEGAFAGADDTGLQQNPGLIYPNHPSVDRRFKAAVDGAIRTGRLSSNNRLGVIVSNCPHVIRAYERSLAPALQRAHIAFQRFNTNCLYGLSDAGPISSQMSSAVLQFRSSGVDRVMFAADTEANVLLAWAPQADSARYYPGYVLSSDAAAVALQDSLPESQLKNMRGTGWAPDADITRAPVTTSATSRCRAILRSQGIEPQTAADRLFSNDACDTFFLLERLLLNSNGAMNYQVAQQAVGALASAYQSPATVSGATYFSSTRHDGAQRFRPFSYVSTCKCFRYTGAPYTFS